MTNTRLGAPAVPWPGTCLGARRHETMREGPEMTNTQDSWSRMTAPGPGAEQDLRLRAQGELRPTEGRSRRDDRQSQREQSPN